MSSNLRIAFFASADIALPCLELLIHQQHSELCAIVTQPSRAKGRGQVVTLNPIGAWAHRHAIPFYEAETMGDAAFQWLQTMQPDCVLVMAFGHILKQRFLDLPPLGMWNLHTSLLPKYRGASPIQAALLNGDRETGVTLMAMEAAMDTGPILAQQTVPIQPNDTAATLFDTLAQASASLLQNALPAILNKTYTLTPQNDAQASYCKKIAKTDGELDFQQPAIQLERRIRAFYPWPGSYFFHKGMRYIVHQAHVVATRPDNSFNNSPAPQNPSRNPQNPCHETSADTSLAGISIPKGTGNIFTNAQKTALYITTQAHLLSIDCLQKAGSKPLNIAEFLRGNPHFFD